MNAKHFFYMHHNLTTILQGSTSTSRLCHTKRTLASVSATATNRNLQLIASNLQQTPIYSAPPSPTQPYAFDGYGYTQPSHPLPAAFNGEYMDTLTGYYLLGNGYRQYIPALRRFNSPDYDSPFDRGGINTYAYVSGDPINFSDPSGRWRISSLFSMFKSKPTIPKLPITTASNSILPIYKNGKLDHTDIPNGAAIGSTQEGWPIVMGHMNADLTVSGNNTTQLSKIISQNFPNNKNPIILGSCNSASSIIDQPYAKELARASNTPVIGFNNLLYGNRLTITNTFKQQHQISPFQDIWQLSISRENFYKGEPKIFYPKPKPAYNFKLTEIISSFRRSR